MSLIKKATEIMCMCVCVCACARACAEEQLKKTEDKTGNPQ